MNKECLQRQIILQILVLAMIFLFVTFNSSAYRSRDFDKKIFVFPKTEKSNSYHNFCSSWYQLLSHRKAGSHRTTPTDFIISSTTQETLCNRKIYLSMNKRLGHLPFTFFFVPRVILSNYKPAHPLLKLLLLSSSQFPKHFST